METLFALALIGLLYFFLSGQHRKFPPVLVMPKTRTKKEKRKLPIIQRAQRQPPPPPKPVAPMPPPPKPVAPMLNPSTSEMFQQELERRKTKQRQKQYFGPPSMSYQAREMRGECVRMVGNAQKVDELYWKLHDVYPAMSTREVYQKIRNDEMYLRGDRWS